MTTPLHHLYAAFADGAGGGKPGRSFDVGPVGQEQQHGIRWRPTVNGGEPIDVSAMAYRLAFCWNMAEGIPLEALEAGCVAKFALAVDDLLKAIDDARHVDEGIAEAVAKVREAQAAYKLDLASDAPAKEPVAPDWKAQTCACCGSDKHMSDACPLNPPFGRIA